MLFTLVGNVKCNTESSTQFDVIPGCIMTFVLLADVEQEKCRAGWYDLKIVLQYA